MGILRLLFAFSVLIYHSGQFFGYNVTNQIMAVLSFFTISGFYMALILDKKYTSKNHTFLFWSNRFLRIFPLYWITLLLTFLFTVLKLVLHLGTDNAIIHYIAWAPHVSPFVFGLSLFNYIMRNITLLVTVDYLHPSNNIPGYLLVQQAWSLQYELLFYLLAPFLVRLSKKIFFIILTVYLVGFWGVVFPLHILQSTLLYGFFSYLIFFLLGIISYRFIYKHFHSKKVHPHILRSVFLIFLIYLLLYNTFHFNFTFPIFSVTDPVYFILLACSLPLIFLQTSASIIDNFIGKLSYPVYVLHFFILKLLSNIPFLKQESNFKTILVIITTLVISYLAVKFIDFPIDRWRQKRVKAVIVATQ